MDYEERLRREVQKDIERYKKTGRLPRENDVRILQHKEHKKKEKIEWTDQKRQLATE